MDNSKQDIWSQWILERRFGGDQEAMQNAFEHYLYPWRDKILEHAGLQPGNVLLDVGCGDGLIAFGALEKEKTSRVIFSDISQDLLDHSRSLAEQMGVSDRCQFICAPAENLLQITDASVDIATTRSVLIYVEDKQQVFREFFRVLKPGGRISLFEPINRFDADEPDHIIAGYDVTPVVHLSRKIKEVYNRLQPLESDPMLNFDERDLVEYAEEAGFKEIHLELQIEIKPTVERENWETIMRIAPNPKVPSPAEAMQEVLTPEEIEEFSAYLRPLVEQGIGRQRSALAYLWATK